MIVGTIAAWLIGKGVSSRIARPLVTVAMISIGIAAAIVAGRIWLASHDRRIISGYESAIQLDLERGARRADQNMTDRRRRRRDEERAARKEFDNATSHLPDEPLSRRQRLDICDELRSAGIDTAAIAGCRDVSAGTQTGAADRDTDAR